MNRKIAVFGAGAYGEEVYLLIQKMNESRLSSRDILWDFVGFFDDNPQNFSGANSYGVVLGDMDALNAFDGELDLAIGIGSSTAIHNILNRITKKDVRYPNIIDPDTGYLDEDSFTIGKGNIIGNGCRFSPKVSVGDFNIIVNDTVFGHDVKIGNYNVFFPEVRLSGKVTVGNDNLFGMRSAVFQGITIGDNVKLSAGSILSINARSGYTYFGNPAKKLQI